MPEISDRSPSHDSVTGRTPSDAVVDLFRDAVVLLGRLAPYIVVLALIVFGAFKFVELERSKFHEVQEARIKAAEENFAEIERLKNQILSDAERITQLQSANVDALAKQISTQREIGSMMTDQTADIARLTSQNATLSLENEKTQKALSAGQAEMAELEEHITALERSADRLELTERAAGDILYVLNRKERFVPTSDVLQLAERYESGSYGHSGRDFAGNAYYGAFRIRGGKDIEGFIAYLQRQAPSRAEALISAGGAAAAVTGSPIFERQWEDLAEHADFRALQRDYIIDQEFRGVVAGCRFNANLDLSQRSVALRAAFVAATVQHGRGSVVTYCDELGLAQDVAAKTDRDLIADLYRWRNEFSADQFGAQDPLIQRLLRLRYVLEEDDARAILAMEQGN